MVKIKVIQIGVGYWGPNLLRNLIELNDFEVVGVVEPSAERRSYVTAEHPGVAVFGSLDEVLNNLEFDAAVVATPVRTHYDIAKRLLEHGVHILVEKPITESTGQLLDLESIAQEKNLVAMSGHTFLFNSAVTYLKSLVDSGELGAIRYIYCQRLNLGRIRSDVDALWNLAPHDISVISYLLGDVEPLSAVRFGASYVQPGVDDVVFLNLTYPEGVIANVHVSWLDPHKTRKITVVGEKKMVVFDDMAESRIAIWDKGIDVVAELGEGMDFDSVSEGFVHRSRGVQYPQLPFQEPLRVELQHYAACIRGESECLTGTSHAKAVLRTLESC